MKLKNTTTPYKQEHEVYESGGKNYALPIPSHSDGKREGSEHVHNAIFLVSESRHGDDGHPHSHDGAEKVAVAEHFERQDAVSVARVAITEVVQCRKDADVKVAHARN